MNNRRLLPYSALLLAACASLAVPAGAQMTSTGLNCSQIQSLNLLKQDNMRAGLTLIECGVVQGGASVGGDSEENEAPAPPNILVSNRTCNSGSSCTKSESMVWAQGSTIVVNFNDHNAGQYAGASYSTNGGATFTQINPPPFTSHGTNYGDPIVVYNAKLAKWFAGDLVGGCGGQGIGLWTSADGITWTTGACAHNGGSDDRESMWVDNNPASTGYGRMYISWNDYNTNCGGGGCLFVTWSNDGTTWSTPKQVNTGSFANVFSRDVQITGTPVVPVSNNITANVPYSTVFLASMDEGGGGLATRQNIMFRSVDGGTSWTGVTTGPRFAAVGDSTCGYFAKVNSIIRHMGWGEPAVGPKGVVHYAYAGAGTSNDHGNIYYVRSTDNGLTWSTPLKLNDDPDAQYHTQWMPSVSSSSNGKVTISWYDRRSQNTACNAVTDPGCSYERYGVQSSNNGATWGSNFAITSSVTPEPAQNDPGVQSCYAGDYDYATATGNNAWVTWTDGRRAVGGTQVQDVNFAAIPQ
jgi:hypothetical protein